MYADTDDELHEMALKIGMKRPWFQGPPEHSNLPHYDLVSSRRAAAVALGAIEHCRHRMVNFMRARSRPGLQAREPIALKYPCCHATPQAPEATEESALLPVHTAQERK